MTEGAVYEHINDSAEAEECPEPKPCREEWKNVLGPNALEAVVRAVPIDEVRFEPS